LKEKESKIQAKVDMLKKGDDTEAKKRLDAETKVREARAEEVAKKNAAAAAAEAKANAPETEDVTGTVEETVETKTEEVSEAVEVTEKVKTEEAPEAVEEIAEASEEKTPEAENKEEAPEA
ncbi:hypothetical protein ACFLSE_05090, partial [Bacteroidota bacterium]